jgi:hypothetical protein
LCIALILLTSPILVIGAYVVSVVWRVSVEEDRYFGRSELIPLRLPARKFDQAPVADSYGHKTLVYESPLGQMIVWRQKINGFQHMFGSAMAAYELGPSLSDRLFCMNEVAEFTLDWNGVEPSDLLDRKKDLVNNAVGRSIGVEAKAKGLSGSTAQNFIAEECAKAANGANKQFIPHYLNPTVFTLSESELGCGCLPQKNLFNMLVDPFKGK